MKAFATRAQPGVSHSGVEEHRRTAAATNLQKTRMRSQTSQTADHVVLNYCDEESEHLPRNSDHEAMQAEKCRWKCMRRTSEQQTTQK